LTKIDEGEVINEITELLLRYASGIDRRDREQLRSCFSDDCHAEYADVGVFEGGEALTEFLVMSHVDMGLTLHRITNIVVALDADGDTARARSYVDAVLMAADGQSGVNPIGMYDDELLRSQGVWCIARRLVTIATYRVIG
jgi:hypothetical protein